MKTLWILLGSLGLILVVIFAFKPRPSQIETTADFEAYLDKMVQGNSPPGVSVAVVKNGEIVYQYATGLADGPNKIAATTDTVYHWWSMTKIVTAIGILQLAEQGLVDLDAPVEDYLPYFETADGKYQGRVTIRQLLRHTSGLPDNVPAIVGWVHTEDVVYDQVEQVRTYMPDYNQLKYDPDSKAVYTNFGYMVLGAVIAEVSGQSYESYVVEHILEPAQMNQTGFLYASDVELDEAVGSHPVVNMMTPILPFLLDMDTIVRERVGLTLWFNRLYLDVTPSSGLIGPADDVARLLAALQDPGLLLSADSLAAMQPTGNGPTERPLGWAEYGMEDQVWVQHSGGGPGFATVARMYPDKGLGIILMANGTNLDRDGLSAALANLPWE